jgi:hypothetical protein
MSRSTKQIEFGKGHTWSFDASETITSGIIVTVIDDEHVRLAHYSEHAIGVTLLPASINKWASVMMNGVVQILITGADATAGQRVRATNGNGFPITLGNAEKHNLEIGYMLESVSNGSKGLVKLYL